MSSATMLRSFAFAALLVAGSANAGSRVFRSADDGYALRAPAGFAVSEEGGRVFVRGGGVMVAAQFHPGVRYDAMETFCERAVELASASGGQVGAPSRWKAKGGRAIAMDFSGPPSYPVRGRSVGIAGPRGALVVLGWATAGDADAGAVRKAVDAIAASVRFFKPKTGSQSRMLVGAWWTGGGKTTRSLYNKNRSQGQQDRSDSPDRSRGYCG